MKVKSLLTNYQNRIEDLPSFLGKLSDLMKEGYKLSEGLTMLLPYYTKDPQTWQEVIQHCLQNGLNASAIFEKLRVDREFLVALHFADQHGDLAQTLSHISKQMQYKESMKAKFKKILAYPLFMFILLITFFFGFRLYFLPNMSHLISSRTVDAGSSVRWSKILLHMPDYFVAIGIFSGITILTVFYYYRKKNVHIQLHFLLKIPLVRYFYRLNFTRQLARNLGNLLITGFTLQQALNELKKQTFKKDLQYIAEIIEERVLYGDSLTQCVRLMPYFAPKFDLFVSHGENSGLLDRELILYCDILDEKMKNGIALVMSIIQPLLFVVIAICIVAAYLSILLPMYKMIDIV